MKNDVDIIVVYPKLKKHLQERFKELNLSYSDIANDAISYGMKNISKSSLSCYFNNKNRGTISQKALLFLCVRYGIELKVSSNVISYNEELMKKNTKQFVSSIL
jgi:hypothetical protein